MAHISFQNLTFAYPDCTQPALCDVSLEVERGQFAMVCGKSGCGKTTLLRHLKTVLAPHGTRTGAVRIDGVPVDQMELRAQSEMVGFVMQNPDSQVVTDKVWHEIAFGLENLGTDAPTMRLRVAEMASFFGIEAWFDKDVADLSGGQKQLLSLASVMAMQPDILVLDEPTSQLDPIAASDFLNTVRKINTELGTTIVMTEHRLEDVYASADVVAVMDEGRLVACGSARSVAARLYEVGHDMCYALPAPMRIFYGVGQGPVRQEQPEGADPSEGASERPSVSQAPLTVREGRTWLAHWCDQHPPRFRRIGADGLPAEGKDHACTAASRADQRCDDGQGMAVQTPGLHACSARDAGSAQAPAIELSDVWMRYERNAPDVLAGVDLQVPAGSVFAIVGGNGAGKSTLLKAVCKVVKPFRGTIRLGGRRLADIPSADLFSGVVSMLPQDPANLFAKKTVREELAEMLPNGLDGEAVDQDIGQMAQRCDIERLLGSHPLDLSGGEQQRAALAKVLLTDPQIVLLDEPTKGIDNVFKRTLAAMLAKLAQEGRTVVIVSHDVEFCARYADQVALLFNGSIALVDSPRSFFSQASFYTTTANRMSRQVFDNAVTEEDVVALCLS